MGSSYPNKRNICKKWGVSGAICFFLSNFAQPNRYVRRLGGFPYGLEKKVRQRQKEKI